MSDTHASAWQMSVRVIGADVPVANKHMNLGPKFFEAGWVEPDRYVETLVPHQVRFPYD